MVDRRQGTSLLLCCSLGLLTALSAHPVDGRQRAIAAPAPFTCDGPNDLTVEHGRITLHGTHFYDHVCVRDKGILATSDALTLLAGALYVAHDSRISADGEDGALYYTHDCDTAGGHVQGLAGSPLTILADQAVIHGAISSNGGRGIDYSLPCGGGSGVLPIGRGGDAGTVTLIARAVVLDGSISARGGDGGAATAKVPAAPGLPIPAPSHDPGADGGRGGGLTLILAHPNVPVLRARLSVVGGHAGRRGAGPRGLDGVMGAIQIRAVTLGDQQRLRIVARDIQISGRVSVAGGAGGGGAYGVQEAGQHGGPGCIKLFATVLRSAGGATPFRNTPFIDASNIPTIKAHFAGSAIVGRLLPKDLKSPPAAKGAQ